MHFPFISTLAGSGCVAGQEWLCGLWLCMACCCFCSVSMSCPCEKCVKRQHRNGMVAALEEPDC